MRAIITRSAFAFMLLPLLCAPALAAKNESVVTGNFNLVLDEEATGVVQPIGPAGDAATATAPAPAPAPTPTLSAPDAQKAATPTPGIQTRMPLSGIAPAPGASKDKNKTGLGGQKAPK